MVRNKRVNYTIDIIMFDVQIWLSKIAVVEVYSRM